MVAGALENQAVVHLMDDSADNENVRRLKKRKGVMVMAALDNAIVDAALDMASSHEQIVFRCQIIV